MGACDFTCLAKGKSAKDAFETARLDAQFEHGHGGYSGTIAEKSGYTMIPLPEGADPYDYADQLIADGDPRIDDKWGPAGCIDLKDGRYLFFGWASE